MSKDAKKAAPKATPSAEQPKLKKIKTGLKGGGSADPCNNVSARAK